MVANISVSEKDKSVSEEVKAYSVEIKAFAKMLYLIVDEVTGKRKFSHKEIVDKVGERFDDSPARSTLTKWTKKWEAELELRENILGGKDPDLLRYRSDSKEYVNRDKLVKAVFSHLRMSLVFYSARMQKYGALEDSVLSSLLEAQTPAAKVKLIEKLMKDNPEAKRLNKVLENFKLVDIQRGVVESNKTFITHLEKLEKWMKLEEEQFRGNVVDTKADDTWEFEPVDIEEFLEGDQFLGKNIYPTLFECVKEDLKEIFYGNPRKILEKRRYKEIMFKEAYGTGKSIRAALLSGYLCYLILCLRNPAKYFKLMPGSKITITNVSVSRKQAKDVVFFKLKSIIDSCPWFRDKGYMYDPNNKLELRFDPADAAKMNPDKVYKNVYITPGSSSEFSAVGYDVICAIIDEATAYGEEGGKDKAEIIYETFRGRVTSRFAESGMLVMAGNPHHVDDFLERRIKDAQDEKDVYVIKQRSLWDAKMPDYDGDWFYFDYGRMKVVDEVERDKENVLRIPVMYQPEFESQPELSTRNLAGVSLESISRFIGNVDKIEEMFVRSARKNPVKVEEDGTVTFDKDFKPRNTGVHAVHVDIGLTNDACAISLGHIRGMEKSNPLFFLDCIVRLQGSQSNPTILEDVRKIIFRFTDLGFNIGPVSYDGYQSTDSIQILNRMGYKAYCLSVDVKMTCYINFRQALYEGRIDCPFHDFFRHELRTLENVNNKKVDHPLKGSKDVADSACGVINSLIEKVPIESIVCDSNAKKKVAIVEDGTSKVRTPEEIFNEKFDAFSKGGA
jgi:hypothetical protein